MAYAEHHRLEKQQQAQQKFRDSHREQVNATRREYYQENADLERQRRRDYHALHKEEEASAQLRWYHKQKESNPNFMQHRRDLRNAETQRLRMEALLHYGGDPPKCACCGETEPKFLSLDHIEGGGNGHRKLSGKKGSEFIRWLRQMGWPTLFQVLCHNCNLAKGFYGVCPHQLRRSDESISASLRITGAD